MNYNNDGCRSTPYGNVQQNCSDQRCNSEPPVLPPLNPNLPPQNAFDSEEMQGSIQRNLADYIGIYVVIEFLIGTERIMRKQGYLYYVSTNYVTLYDDVNTNFILCDIYSIKFVYYYYPGQRPNRNYNILPAMDGNRS